VSELSAAARSSWPVDPIHTARGRGLLCRIAGYIPPRLGRKSRPQLKALRRRGTRPERSGAGVEPDEAVLALFSVPRRHTVFTISGKTRASRRGRSLRLLCAEDGGGIAMPLLEGAQVSGAGTSSISRPRTAPR